MRILTIIAYFISLLPFLAASQEGPRDTEKGTELPGDSTIIINKIRVEGNEKTRTRIILREMTVREGDTISNNSFENILRQNRENIKNTGLFSKVQLGLNQPVKGYHILVVRVKERWYTIPAPILELADRNFNVWWNYRDHNLDRLNYGLRFTQKNVRGRNEELKGVVQFGFAEKFELFYTIPYFDLTQKTGIKLGASYAQNRKTAYDAYRNRLRYFEGSQPTRKRFYALLSLTRREAIHNTHNFEIQFHSNWIDSKIKDLNDNYFLNGAQRQKYFSLLYTYEVDHRDWIPYPLDGSYLLLGARKMGLGIMKNLDIIDLNGSYFKYFTLGNDLFFSTSIKGKYALWGKQPFIVEEALGYEENFVRGYEYYVINGESFALNRNSFKYRFIDWEWNNLDFIPLKQFRNFPLDIYVKIFADQGYVWDRNPGEFNFLHKQYLSGGGAGIDIVTLYDLVFRIEYSVNLRKETDLFLHFEKAF